MNAATPAPNSKPDVVSPQAVVRFLETANPQGEFFMIGFADRPALLRGRFDAIVKPGKQPLRGLHQVVFPGLLFHS